MLLLILVKYLTKSFAINYGFNDLNSLIIFVKTDKGMYAFAVVGGGLFNFNSCV